MLALIEPVFGLIGAWGLFAAIAPKLRTEIWWMRVWVYGRLQTCLVLLAAAALYISLYPAAELGNASLLMAYAVAFLICAADIQPYLPGRKRELRRAKAGANGTPLSILLINVLQENEDHTAVISRIRDSHADVLFLSETNARWRDALSDLEKDYPHTYLWTRKIITAFCSIHATRSIRPRNAISVRITCRHSRWTSTWLVVRCVFIASTHARHAPATTHSILMTS